MYHALIINVLVACFYPFSEGPNGVYFVLEYYSFDKQSHLVDRLALRFSHFYFVSLVNNDL